MKPQSSSHLAHMATTQDTAKTSSCAADPAVTGAGLGCSASQTKQAIPYQPARSANRRLIVLIHQRVVRALRSGGFELEPFLLIAWLASLHLLSDSINLADAERRAEAATIIAAIQAVLSMAVGLWLTASLITLANFIRDIQRCVANDARKEAA